MGSASQHRGPCPGWGKSMPFGSAMLENDAPAPRDAALPNIASAYGMSQAPPVTNASYLLAGPYHLHPGPNESGAALAAQAGLGDDGAYHHAHPPYPPHVSHVLSPGYPVAHHHGPDGALPAALSPYEIAMQDADVLAGGMAGARGASFEGVPADPWLARNGYLDASPTSPPEAAGGSGGGSAGPSPVERPWGAGAGHLRTGSLTVGDHARRPGSRASPVSPQRSGGNSPASHAVSPTDDAAAAATAAAATTAAAAAAAPRDDTRRASFLERNRVAAFKCREKKKVQVSHLEQKVRRLQRDKAALQLAATGLRDEVRLLREEMLTHVGCGCAHLKGFLDRQADSICRDEPRCGVRAEELERLLRPETDGPA